MTLTKKEETEMKDDVTKLHTESAARLKKRVHQIWIWNGALAGTLLLLNVVLAVLDGWVHLIDALLPLMWIAFITLLQMELAEKDNIIRILTGISSLESKWLTRANAQTKAERSKDAGESK